MANNKPIGSGDERLAKEQPKRTYHKPAFRFERVFETQALSCGKLPGGAGQCKLRGKTS